MRTIGVEVMVGKKMMMMRRGIKMMMKMRKMMGQVDLRGK